MIRRVALVKTDVSEERIAFIISVTRIGGTPVLTRTTPDNIPQDDIVHSNSRENVRSYIAFTGWTL
jgi:hypothetical protein